MDLLCMCVCARVYVCMHKSYKYLLDVQLGLGEAMTVQLCMNFKGKFVAFLNEQTHTHCSYEWKMDRVCVCVCLLMLQQLMRTQLIANFSTILVRVIWGIDRCVCAMCVYINFCWRWVSVYICIFLNGIQTKSAWDQSKSYLTCLFCCSSGFMLLFFCYCWWFFLCLSRSLCCLSQLHYKTLMGCDAMWCEMIYHFFSQSEQWDLLFCAWMFAQL